SRAEPLGGSRACRSPGAAERNTRRRGRRGADGHADHGSYATGRTDANPCAADACTSEPTGGDRWARAASARADQWARRGLWIGIADTNRTTVGRAWHDRAMDDLPGIKYTRFLAGIDPG